MRASLRAGIAIYNAGEYHAAHDAWEDEWLAIKDESDREQDERLLHGLIQFTAAIHHAQSSNWDAVEGLAESAGEYLAELPSGYRDVNVDTVREALASLAHDPQWLNDRDPPPLVHDGEAIDFTDLDFEAIAIVAEVLAEERDSFSRRVLAHATELAREAIEADRTNEYVTLVFDFVTKPENRETVYRRITDHVERHQSRVEDVDGLFESS